METLKQFKDKLIQKGVSGLTVDIDETLSWTIGAWVKQLQLKFGNPENLSVEEIIAKYRYSYNVPYWQTPEAFTWMEEQRNSNEFQETLPVIEGAHDALWEVSGIVPILAYLTIRPESVLKGTRNWLQRHNFPKAEVLLRPAKITHGEGNQWKAKTLEYLYPEVTGIIDDNPSLPDLLSERYLGKIYLYDNNHYQRQNIRVAACKTWGDILTQVKQDYSGL